MNYPIIIVGAVVGAIVGGIVGKKIRQRHLSKQLAIVLELGKEFDKSIEPMKNTPLPNTNIRSVNNWVSQVQHKHHG